jgi:hypothetical protein
MRRTRQKPPILYPLITFVAAAAFLTIPALIPDALAQVSLDPDSAKCVGCHQTFIDPDSPGLVCHSEGCNHAIGIDYNDAVTRRPSLAPADRLDPRVRLVGGRIGCTTCHVPFSLAEHQTLANSRADESAPDPMLVLDNSGSALCLVCHRM